MPKLVLHDIHAAPIADLDYPHEPWQCAACGDEPTHLFVATWPNAPAGYPPPEVSPDPLIQHVHAALGTNFDFAACEQHIAEWGRPAGAIREIPITSSGAASIVLRFARVS